MKRIVIAILVLMMVVTGCQQAEKTYDMELSVKMPAGIPTLSLVKMMKENPEIMKGVTMTYESLPATDVIVSDAIKGDLDFAIVPTNLASVLFHKGAEYQLAAITSHGNLYIVGDQEIASIDDLKGAQMNTFGQGLVPDIILRYVLNGNGINPDEDMTLNYLSGASELVPQFVAKKTNMSLMPEPALTAAKAKREDATVIVDLQAEFAKLTGGDQGYPMAGIIVKKSLVEEHPEVVEAVLAEMKASVAWINENPETAGEYYEALELGLPKGVVQTAIPGANVKYVDIKDMQEDVVSFFELINATSPNSIGGSVPDEAIFYKAK